MAMVPMGWRPLSSWPLTSPAFTGSLEIDLEEGMRLIGRPTTVGSTESPFPAAYFGVDRRGRSFVGEIGKKEPFSNRTSGAKNTVFSFVNIRYKRALDRYLCRNKPWAN